MKDIIRINDNCYFLGGLCVVDLNDKAALETIKRYLNEIDCDINPEIIFGNAKTKNDRFLEKSKKKHTELREKIEHWTIGYSMSKGGLQTVGINMNSHALKQKKEQKKREELEQKQLMVQTFEQQAFGYNPLDIMTKHIHVAERNQPVGLFPKGLHDVITNIVKIRLEGKEMEKRRPNMILHIKSLVEPDATPIEIRVALRSDPTGWKLSGELELRKEGTNKMLIKVHSNLRWSAARWLRNVPQFYDPFIDQINGSLDNIPDAIGKNNHCFVCGRPLEVSQSKLRGIGPVCYESLPDYMIRFLYTKDTLALNE